MFKNYSAESVSRIFFKSYFYACMFLAVISLIGLFLGSDITETLAGVLFISIVAFLGLNTRFRKMPFSSLLIFFTLIYLCIPIFFIIIKGGDYFVGNSIEKIPFEQSDYKDSRALGILFLIMCWFSVWLGIVTPKFKIIQFNQDETKIISISEILLLGLFVSCITALDAVNFNDVKILGIDRSFSILSFIFFDHAYLAIAGTLIFFISHNFSMRLEKRIGISLSIIYFIFVCVGFLSGSKASILSAFILLVLYPFALSTQYVNVNVVFIKPAYLVLLALISPAIFNFALIKRIGLSTGIDLNIYDLFIEFFDTEPEQIMELIDSIFYRLSWGGLDQYFLLFQSFLVDGYDYQSANNFLTYLFKNTLNLLLPGTPFPEAYAPTSQLLPHLLFKEPLVSVLERTQLVLSLNTQPYSLFGIFIVLFGLFAPISLYLFSAVLSFVYFRFNSFIPKLVMLYFFFGALSSYGIEAVIGNSGIFFVSLFSMYFLLKLLSRLQIQSYFRNSAN